MSEDEALSEAFGFADAAFRKFAEMTAANDGAPFEEAHMAICAAARKASLPRSLMKAKASSGA